MSKPISFGFGKANATTKTPATATKTSASISLPAKRPQSGIAKPRIALRADDEDVDDEEPQHEAVAGFSTSGAILTQPKEEPKARIIENKGNFDWRTRGRGKNILPSEVQAARDGSDVLMVEKNEVSTASGLQFATSGQSGSATSKEPELVASVGEQSKAELKPRTADEEALAALLGEGSADAPKSTAVIEQSEDTRFGVHSEEEDFRTDVATRPESSTLEDYASMPVEEFGLAMLRGMGKKRRANGELIQLESKEESPKKTRKQDGFLGIGAKAAPGMDGVELGAWGKADMKKNAKGQGFFTPLMVRDKKTGEVVTEEEMERRSKAVKEGEREGEEEWRKRRERNLERHGRDKERDVNGHSRRHRDSDGYDSSRSRRERDDSDYDSSRSRRHRSRSRDRDRRRNDYDDEKYESSSSRKDRDRDRDRERYRDNDRDRHRSDRDRHR